MTINEKCKVLIVDDRKENLIALEAILDELNLELLKANSGNEALGLLIEHNDIAMVLLDVQMPEMDGFEVVELMKCNERTKYIPVIFITAISSEDRYKFRAYHVGAVDFILKPIIPEILVSKVKVFKQLHEQKQKIIHQTLALEHANNKLMNLSYLDGLTQIPNRRNLDIFLEKEWEIAKNGNQPLSLLMIDIDFFKNYNDFYGHVKGDDCLKEVVKSLENTVKRSGYFISRYGGEEFIVVMPNTNKAVAEEFANKLCNTVFNLKIEHLKSFVAQYVTISVGVATDLPNEDITPESLIKNADIALYKAKELGRSKVVVFD
jgi:diguanylate cyclase (GGDEF)-like protein